MKNYIYSFRKRLLSGPHYYKVLAIIGLILVAGGTAAAMSPKTGANRPGQPQVTISAGNASSRITSTGNGVTTKGSSISSSPKTSKPSINSSGKTTVSQRATVNSDGTVTTADGCTISVILVNSCRPWLSAAVAGYPQAGGSQQFAYFVDRLNNPLTLTSPSAKVSTTYKLDVPHIYHSENVTLLNGLNVANDAAIVTDTSYPMLVNYKPGHKWADTAAGNYDAGIIASAKAVKALGTRKIFLTLWHEPENGGDLSAGDLSITGKCKTPTGTRGTAADYRAMWHHVQSVFDDQGVSNVVWVWDLTGYVGPSGWDCVVKPLWPGNASVDWVMWDPYASGGDFVNSVSRFYNFLTDNSDSAHDFTSKPWGLAEMGSNTSASEAANYWRGGKAALGSGWSTNQFPRIKLYSVFDTSNNGGTNGGLRVGYDVQGNISIPEQTAYDEFAKAILNYGQ